MSSTNSAQSTPSKATASARQKATRTPSCDLLASVKTLQFAWFVGHAVTWASSTMFFLTYLRVFPSASQYWYKTALLGVLESFGVLIYQSVTKNGFSVSLWLRDDNVQYLALALVLFVHSPYVALTLSTFFLFSTFHVLSYAKHNLLPAMGIPDAHPVSARIGDFIAANNNKSIALAALLEVYTGAWMFLRVIAFRAVSLVPFLAYVVFLKLRHEKSQFTRAALKSVELRMEDLVNMSGNPMAKEAWVNVKAVFSHIGSTSLTGKSRPPKAI